MNQQSNAASVADGRVSGKSAQLQAVREARRSSNKVRRLHHHAVRTDDMEATRRFYEDLLGMPMVITLKCVDDTAGGGKPFLHCFFEMGDGSALAFFEYLPDAYGPATSLPKDGIDHHIAMSVSDFDDIIRMKAKFDESGYLNCGVDHGFCYSLYVRDPNGMLVEFVGDAPNELEINEAAARSAHDELTKWRDKDYSINDLEMTSSNFPLPTSPGDDILKVIRGIHPEPPLGQS